MTGSSEHSNEPSSSIRGRKFLDQLHDCHISRRALLHVVSCTKSTKFNLTVSDNAFNVISALQRLLK